MRRKTAYKSSEINVKCSTLCQSTQITVSGGGCSGALSLTTVSGGSITAITVVAGGNNHNSQPSVINKHSCLLK